MIGFSRLILVGSVAAGMLDLNSVHAQDATDSVIHDCENCTLQQAKDYAASLGNGLHYVYDLAGNHIYYFNASCEPGFNGTMTCTVNSRSVPANIQTSFTQLRTAWGANFHSQAFTDTVQYNMPSGGPVGPDHLPQDNGMVNAYDTVVASSYYNSLVTKLGNPATYAGAMGNVISSISNLPLNTYSAPDVTVTVIFNDGSRRKFTWNKSLGQFVSIPGTAMDAHNNTLPEPDKPAAVGAQYLYNGLPTAAPYDYRNMYHLFPGVPVIPAHGCMQERWDGQTLTCIHPY